MSKKERFSMVQSRRFEHRIEKVFELICPVRNADWMPGWGDIITMIHSQSGRAELGCVFKVADQPHLLGQATLICTVYEQPREVEYTAMNDHFVYQIHWRFQPKDGGTEAKMERTWTALDDKGLEYLVSLTGRDNDKTPPLFELLGHYLDTGEMLAR